ncbi:MAG: ABC transporter substrate-binding protein [Haloarculaceae archaeon]
MDSNDITRRRAVSLLGATGVAGLAGCGGDGEEATTTTESDGADGGDMTTTTAGDGDGMTTTQSVSGAVTIGWLNPHSGALSYYGNHTLWSFYAGLKYRSDGAASIPESGAGTGEYTISVGDVDYEIIVSDSQGDPGEGQTIATEYVNQDNVDFLVGGTSSATANAVAKNVANQAQVPYMAAPAAAVSVTGSPDTCSEYVFRANENVAMDARAGADYVANETDIDRVHIYYADYSFGQDVANNYQRVLENNGVTVTGRVPLPRTYSEDWEGQLDKAQDANAGGIVTGFTVATLPALFTTFLNNADRYDFNAVGGLTTWAGSAALGGTVAKVLGEDFTAQDLQDVGMGPFTTRFHWNQYDNEINEAFTETLTSTYGYWPDLFGGGAFTAASGIDQAVRESGSTDSDDIRGALRGMTVTDTPKGENQYKFQAYNGQARSPMTVADVIPTKEDNQEYWPKALLQPAEPKRTYGMDQTTWGVGESDLMTCDL